MNRLQSVIQQHTHRRRLRTGWQASQKAPTIEEFNKKLTETDSYLQILINQFQKIDQKISNAPLDIEKAQLSTLKDQSAYLLDSIKHTIVLLQIAKVSPLPVMNHLTRQVKS